MRKTRLERPTELVIRNTVSTHNSDTPNSDVSQNSDTLFGLTKMSLFWAEEDFAIKYRGVRCKVQWVKTVCTLQQSPTVH